jgi:hypothetical protein
VELDLFELGVKEEGVESCIFYLEGVLSTETKVFSGFILSLI